MKKLLLVILTVMAINFIALSQPYQKGTLSLSMGAEVLFTERKLSASHHTGFGGTAKAEYVFSRHTSVTLASGYYFMDGKNTPLTKYGDISAVPVKAGLRQYIGDFYASGEAGALLFMGFNKGTNFVYSLGLGDKIHLAGRVFDIGLRHEGWAVSGINTGSIALRVGYEFAVNEKSTISRAAF